jgi:xanthine dehydrogenase iron-sulfur cluster and FAD-binding subunit A
MPARASKAAAAIVSIGGIGWTSSTASTHGAAVRGSPFTMTTVSADLGHLGSTGSP